MPNETLKHEVEENISVINNDVNELFMKILPNQGYSSLSKLKLN